MRVQLTLATGVQIAMEFTRVTDSRQINNNKVNFFAVVDAISCKMESATPVTTTYDPYFGRGYSYRTRADEFSWLKGCEVAMHRAMEYIDRDKRKLVWEAWKAFVQLAEANHRSLTQQAAHEEAARNRKPEPVLLSAVLMEPPAAPQPDDYKIKEEDLF